MFLINLSYNEIVSSIYFSKMSLDSIYATFAALSFEAFLYETTDKVISSSIVVVAAFT